MAATLPVGGSSLLFIAEMYWPSMGHSGVLKEFTVVRASGHISKLCLEGIDICSLRRENTEGSKSESDQAEFLVDSPWRWPQKGTDRERNQQQSIIPSVGETCISHELLGEVVPTVSDTALAPAPATTTTA